MTKQFKLLLLIIIYLSGMPLLLSSCSKDEPSGTSIVGTWTCSNHYYGGSDTYVFKKNGTYNWSYTGSADWFTNQTGTYTYDGAILTTSRESGWTLMYVVIGLSESTLVIMDEDGYKYTYYRE